METHKIVVSQYLASLEMLKQAVDKCPDSLWYSDEYENSYWQIAYHVLFYTHLYLQPTEEDFVPWEKHKDLYRNLAAPAEELEDMEPFSRVEVLDYLEFCRGQVEEIVPALDFSADSGFYWLPFSKLETQFYNIRHLQQHTGELSERLGAKGEIEVSWVGRRPD